MTRRRISATLDGHHWPQPRALLPLVTRRPFRGDTRRGFAVPSTWVAGQHWLAGARLLGLLVDEAECLACRRPGSTLGTPPTGRGYPTTQW